MAKPITRLVLPLMLLTSLACEFALGPQPSVTPGVAMASALIKASVGGTVALADGAALLIPPGALQRDTQVSLEAVQGHGPAPQSPDPTTGAGSVYHVDMGTDQLLTAVALQIPFDPALVPSDAEAAQVFLATFDEPSGTWVYAGGTVDLSRHVVTAAITHASWWQPATWNWTAWPALLGKTLSLNPVDIGDAAKLMFAGCEQKGTYVNVERREKTALVQGCIDKDDPSQPVLRLVNPGSIPFEVSAASGGNNYPPQQLLDSGDSLTFAANTKDPSPLVVSAKITKKSASRLVLGMILDALPGGTVAKDVIQMKEWDQKIACLVSLIPAPFATDDTAVGDALFYDQYKAGPNDAYIKLFQDESRMQGLKDAALKCRFDLVLTFSPKAIAKVAEDAGTVSSLMTQIDTFHKMIFEHASDTVAFDWSSPATPRPTARPTAQSTNPPSVSSLSGTVTQLSNCRYGPDYPYLYKYGVRAGTRMEVIGRDADGNWLQARGVGGSNACWIKAAQMQVDGDVMGLPDAYPTTTGLPISPFFERITLTGVSSSGGAVNVSWLEHTIRSDLGTEQGFEYIVEVWTCVNGKPNFSAIGTNDTSASFQIDNSCGVSSHADVIGEDKEGFSVPAIIALP